MKSNREVAKVTMDAQVALSSVENEFRNMVSDLDRAIRADLANDPFLTAGLDLIRDALSRMDPRSEAYKDLYAAKAQIQKATDLDFNDQTKEQAKGRLCGILDKVERANIAFSAVSGCLDGGAR